MVPEGFAVVAQFTGAHKNHRQYSNDSTKQKEHKGKTESCVLISIECTMPQYGGTFN